MRVSDSRRVLFVHVPKTGGSSIDLMFDTQVPDARRVPDRQRHAPYGRLLNAEPELADYWSFGLVRNPWARMVSWWTMIHTIFDRADAGNPKAIAKIRNEPTVWLKHEEFRHDFDKFVLEAPAKNPKVGRPQIKTLSAGDRTVDFIGRLENFADDITVIRERLGLPVVDPLPHTNRSRHGDYRDYYNDTTRDRVAEDYALDVDAFGYTF
jgi:hypothetical protein